MFKVLIVDDELPAREILTNIIDWNKAGFVVADTAKNGKDALNKYSQQNFDLVITDIQMPGMDGLELIRNIRQINKHQKFIILSCHENFLYAKEAIKLGITDYLLKHLLTPEDLYSVLQKVKLELEDSIASKNTIQPFINLTKINEFDDNEYRTIPVKALVFENPDEDYIKTTIHKHNLDLLGDYFTLFCIVIDDYKKILSGLSQTSEIKEIKKILATINESFKATHSGECFYNGNGEFVALICIENIKSDLIYISTCYSIVQKIKTIVFSKYNITLTFGICTGFNNLSVTNAKYIEASNTVKYRMFYGKGATLFHHMHIVKNKMFKPELIESKLEHIRNYLNQDNLEQVHLEVQKLYTGDLKGFMQYNYIKHVNSYMFNIIIEYMNRKQIAYTKIFNVNYMPIDEVDTLETIEEISNWFCDIFTKINKLKEQIKQADTNIFYSKRVNDIIEYVKKNYDRNIGLSQMSDDLMMNKSYLCRLFKNETGENFTDFLSKYRIDIAKNMITNENYKLYEIAEKTGFSNAQQFSAVFKKITGQNPIDYKCKFK